jgi:hypothetical protein
LSPTAGLIFQRNYKTRELEPEGFGGTFKETEEVYVKRDEEKQKQKIDLMATTVERMVDKKVGLWCLGRDKHISANLRLGASNPA